MKIFFAAIITALLPLITFAAPSISGTSGSFSSGQSVTVSGAGFGSKSPVAPLVWSDHENCPLNGDIVATCGYENLNNDGSKAYIKSDRYYGTRGQKSARMDYEVAENSMFPGIGHNISGGAEQIYISYQAYWTRYAGEGLNPATGLYRSPVFKWSRAGAGDPYHGYPQFHDTIRPGQDGLVGGGDRGAMTASVQTYDNSFNGPNSDRWNRMEYYYKLSSPSGTANGIFQQQTNSSQNTNLENIVTRDASESGKLIDWVISAFDGNDTYYVGTGYYLWMDDYYVDTTQARAEICSGSTWANRGTCEVQIPQTTWNDTGLQIGVNQGSFADGSSQYLYVVDSNGATNPNGYQITFGTDTVAPSSPSGLSVN